MWSNPEKAAVKMAQKALGWNDPQYRLVLRNAGVRPWPDRDGPVSATNPHNDTDTFVRFMAIAERSGYVDPKRGAGFWIAESQKQCTRMHHKIKALAQDLHKLGVMDDPAAALAGFIFRMTKERPLDQGGPTNVLMELDAEWSYKVIEGLKKWLWREQRKHGTRDLGNATREAHELPF